MGTKIVEGGVDSIASDESASLAALHLQIGRRCQSARSDLLEHRPDGADTFDTLYSTLVVKSSHTEKLSQSTWQEYCGQVV